MRRIVRPEQDLQMVLIGLRIEQQRAPARERQHRAHPVVDEIGIGDMSPDAGSGKIRRQNCKPSTNKRNGQHQESQA